MALENGMSSKKPQLPKATDGNDDAEKLANESKCKQALEYYTEQFKTTEVATEALNTLEEMGTPEKEQAVRELAQSNWEEKTVEEKAPVVYYAEIAAEVSRTTSQR